MNEWARNLLVGKKRESGGNLVKLLRIILICVSGKRRFILWASESRGWLVLKHRGHFRLEKKARLTLINPQKIGDVESSIIAKGKIRHLTKFLLLLAPELIYLFFVKIKYDD